MAIPNSYSGVSWGDLYANMVINITAAQGTEPTVNLPKLSNGQALALLMAFRDFAKRHTITVPFWPELWYELLGHVRPNDRFLMTATHAAKLAEPALLESTWYSIKLLCDDFDRIVGAAPVTQKIDQSWAGYRKAANVAWLQLQQDRLKDPDKNPIILPPPPPSGNGLAILLGLLVIAYIVK